MQRIILATLVAALYAGTAAATGSNHHNNNTNVDVRSAASAFSAASTSQSTTNSNNAKQSTDVSFSSPRNPAAAMPGAANTTASCRLGISAGVGGLLPIGIGGTVLDKICDKRESARLHMEMAKVAHAAGYEDEFKSLMLRANALLTAADAEAAGDSKPFEPTPSESYAQ